MQQTERVRLASSVTPSDGAPAGQEGFDFGRAGVRPGVGLGVGPNVGLSMDLVMDTEYNDTDDDGASLTSMLPFTPGASDYSSAYLFNEDTPHPYPETQAAVMVQSPFASFSDNQSVGNPAAQSHFMAPKLETGPPMIRPPQLTYHHYDGIGAPDKSDLAKANFQQDSNHITKSYATLKAKMKDIHSRIQQSQGPLITWPLSGFMLLVILLAVR